MTKPSQFKAYDIDRKNPHTIDAPPVKLHQHRFDRGDWAVSTRRGPAANTRAAATRTDMCTINPYVNQFKTVLP